MRSLEKRWEEVWNKKTLEEKKEWNREVYGHEVPNVGTALSRAQDAKKKMDEYFKLMINPVYGQQFTGDYFRWKKRYEENMAYYEKMKDCKLIE